MNGAECRCILHCKLLVLYSEQKDDKRFSKRRKHRFEITLCTWSVTLCDMLEKVQNVDIHCAIKLV